MVVRLGLASRKLVHMQVQGVRKCIRDSSISPGHALFDNALV